MLDTQQVPKQCHHSASKEGVSLKCNSTPYCLSDSLNKLFVVFTCIETTIFKGREQLTRRSCKNVTNSIYIGSGCLFLKILELLFICGTGEFPGML